MNARRASRELALLTLFQLEKQGPKDVSKWDISKLSLEELILSAVRLLADEAKTKIEDAAKDLALVSDYLYDVEVDDPLNTQSDIDALLKPAPLPNTRQTAEKVNQCLLAAEYLAEALRIPELVVLANDPAVTNYTVRLVETVCQHQAELDALINEASDDWRVERLVQMDAWILRLATAEMKYMADVDVSVSIDEAVELAQEFSTDESFKFINGILGNLAKQLAEIKPETQAHA